MRVYINGHERTDHIYINTYVSRWYLSTCFIVSIPTFLEHCIGMHRATSSCITQDKDGKDENGCYEWGCEDSLWELLNCFIAYDFVGGNPTRYVLSWVLVLVYVVPSTISIPIAWRNFFRLKLLDGYVIIH